MTKVTNCRDCPFASIPGYDDVSCGLGSEEMWLGRGYTEDSPPRDCPLRDGPETVVLDVP